MERLQEAKTIWPDEILRLPQVEFHVPGVRGHTLKNDEKQVTFLSFEAGTVVPDHSHGAQWGYLVAGEMTLQIEDRTELFSAGDIYYIPAATSHRTSFSKDSYVIDMGDDPHRYPVVSAS
jgi:quercetin dioxygenase-like cupin family protein